MTCFCGIWTEATHVPPLVQKTHGTGSAMSGEVIVFATIWPGADDKWVEAASSHESHAIHEVGQSEGYNSKKREGPCTLLIPDTGDQAALATSAIKPFIWYFV